MNTIVNAIVFNAVLSLADANRKALDFRNRSFVYDESGGRDKRNADLLIGAKPRPGIDADKHAENLKAWKKTHFPVRDQVASMAALSNVTTVALDKELETMRLAELARVKAEADAAEAMKKGAKKSATVPADTTSAKAA